MDGQVINLAAARAAHLNLVAAPHAATAARYVLLAEQAIDVIPTLKDAKQRAAVCRITEVWLAMAEAELDGI